MLQAIEICRTHTDAGRSNTIGIDLSLSEQPFSRKAWDTTDTSVKVFYNAARDIECADETDAAADSNKQLGLVRLVAASVSVIQVLCMMPAYDKRLYDDLISSQVPKVMREIWGKFLPM